MMKKPSRAKYYTGFSPIISGYNGENGLIKQMTVYQCKNEVTRRADVDGDACTELIETSCSKIAFVWRPGVAGESFDENSGIFSPEKYLLLEILYNPGTGWLLDQSGFKIFYSTIEVERRISKVAIMSDKNYGICTPGCFNQGAKLVSALVIADVAEQSHNDIILFNDQAVIVSGYTVDYQPIRQVLNQPTVTKMQLSCALHDKDDENEKCWALVTILGDNDFNECGTRDDGVSYCKTFDEFQLKGPIDASLPEKKSRCQGATINMKRNPESANKEMEIMPQITTTKINSENPPSIKSVFTERPSIVSTLEMSNVTLKTLQNMETNDKEMTKGLETTNKSVTETTLEMSNVNAKTLKSMESSDQEMDKGLEIATKSVTEIMKEIEIVPKKTKTMTESTTSESSFDYEIELETVENNSEKAEFDLLEISNKNNSASSKNQESEMSSTLSDSERFLNHSFMIEETGNSTKGDFSVGETTEYLTDVTNVPVLINITRESRLLQSATKSSKSDESGEIMFEQIYKNSAIGIQCFHTYLLVFIIFFMSFK